MLSWPFGIYDNELMDRATRAGDIAAVTLDRRHATAADAIMALPRYLVTDGARGGEVGPWTRLGPYEASLVHATRTR